MAYALIKKMNGLLSARLEGGGLVYFDLYLPQVESEGAAVSPNRAGEAAVMLVEPTSEVRRVLISHFEQHGYNVLEAATCGEALLLAELYDGAIPLAIANPGKGNETRKELTNALKAIKPGVSVRLLDGYWEDRDAEGSQGSQTGCHFLTKWDMLRWVTSLGPDQRPAADCVSASK
jgi:CheY-like chemotaxis protein